MSRRLLRKRLTRLRYNPSYDFEEVFDDDDDIGGSSFRSYEPSPVERRRTELYERGWAPLDEYRNDPVSGYHVNTQYICVAPPEDCAEEWASIGDRFVEKPEAWVDFSFLDEPWPSNELHGWLYLAQQIQFHQFPSLWNTNPEAAAEWLSQRIPSRKGLEKKFRKYMEELKPQYNFRDRAVPEWVELNGGRHVADEYDLRTQGKKNDWCFGAGSYSRYLKGILMGDRLYFIPHSRGLIAALVRPEDERSRGIRFSDDLGDWILIEAMFPQNQPATRVVFAMIDSLLENR